MSFTVVDNGDGITPQDLKCICIPGNTSKFHQGLDEPFRTYGFRGQSLSSIGSQSMLLISSRHKDFNRTLSIRVNNGERSQVYQSSEPFSNSATTVRCSDLFSNYPVRQRQVLSIPEQTHIEQLKRYIFPIVIAYDKVCISIHGLNFRRLFFISEYSKESKFPRNIELLRAIHGLPIAKAWDIVEARSSNSSAKATICHNQVSSKSSQHIGELHFID